MHGHRVATTSAICAIFPISAAVQAPKISSTSISSLTLILASSSKSKSRWCKALWCWKHHLSKWKDVECIGYKRLHSFLSKICFSDVRLVGFWSKTNIMLKISWEESSNSPLTHDEDNPCSAKTDLISSPLFPAFLDDLDQFCLAHLFTGGLWITQLANPANLDTSPSMATTLSTPS